MKMNELKVGEEYRTQYSLRCTVLELKAQRESRTGSILNNGVRVRYAEKASWMASDEEVILASQLSGLWAEYEQELKMRELAREVAERDAAAYNQLLDRCVAALSQRGITVTYHPVYAYSGRFSDDSEASLRITRSQAEQLLALLEAVPVEQAAQIRKPDAAQSALESLLLG